MKNIMNNTPKHIKYYKQLIHILIIFIFICSYNDNNITYAANWAQSSGYIEQNNVFPYIPSPATKHWQARYGSTSITIPSVSLCIDTVMKALFCHFLYYGYCVLSSIIAFMCYCYYLLVSLLYYHFYIYMLEYTAQI